MPKTGSSYSYAYRKLEFSEPLPSENSASSRRSSLPDFPGNRTFFAKESQIAPTPPRRTSLPEVSTNLHPSLPYPKTAPVPPKREHPPGKYNAQPGNGESHSKTQNVFHANLPAGSNS